MSSSVCRLPDTPGIVKFAILAAPLLAFSGCCWLSKRDCYPPCPPQPTKVVTVEKPCDLPGPLVLEEVRRTLDGCPEKMSCYDIENSAKLARRQAAMKDWIKSARIRCGSPRLTSQPKKAH